MHSSSPIGNTQLHDLARQSLSITDFAMQLKSIDPPAIQKMALTFNKDHQLPIDLLADSFMSLTDQEKARHLLLDYMQPTEYKKLSTPLNGDEILQKYRHLDGRVVCNLIFATQVANHARKIIQKSSTHPEMNKTAKENLVEDIHLTNLVDTLRYLLPPFPLTKEHEDKVDFEFCIDVIEAYKVGNCQEFSMYAYYLFRKNGYDHPVEIFSLTPGDHLFVAVDRDPKSNPKDPDTWGPHCVICDAWMGEVYPATELWTHMRSYKEILIEDQYQGKPESFSYNVLPFIHPKMHSFRKLKTYHNEQERKEGYGIRYRPLFESTQENARKRKSMSSNDTSFKDPAKHKRSSV